MHKNETCCLHTDAVTCLVSEEVKLKLNNMVLRAVRGGLPASLDHVLVCVKQIQDHVLV